MQNQNLMQFSYTQLPTSPRDVAATSNGTQALYPGQSCQPNGVGVSLERNSARVTDPLQLLEQRGKAHAAAMIGHRRFDSKALMSTWTLHPRNPVFGFWNPLMMMAIFVDCFVQPFRATFQRFLEQKSLVVLLYNLSSGAWIMYTIDTFMQFVVQCPKEGGAGFITSSAHVVRNYLRSQDFIIDLITLIPWHLVHDFTTAVETDLGANAESRGFLEVIVDMLPLFRLLRLRNLRRLTFRYANTLHVSFATHTCVLCGFGLGLCLHVLACLWSLVGLENPLKEDQTWIRHYYMANEEQGRFYPTAVQVYLASMYWALATTTSIGYGDVVPAPCSSAEQIACIILMCVAALSWSIIIANTVELVKDMHSASEAYQKTMDACEKVFKSNGHLDESLTESIREYFRKSYEMDMQTETQELISRMSPMLQRNVVQAIYAEWIEDVPWIAAMSGPCLVRVVLRMQNFLYIPGEIIPDSRMTQFVHMGSLFIGGRIMSKGDSWGVDMTMEGNQRRRENGFSMNFVSTLGLTYRHLIDVLEDFPNDAWMVKRASCWMAVRRRIRQIAAQTKRYHRSNVFVRATTIVQDNTGAQEFGQLSDDARYTVKVMKELFDEHHTSELIVRQESQVIKKDTLEVKKQVENLDVAVRNNTESLRSVEQRLGGIESSMARVLTLLQEPSSPTRKSSGQMFKRGTS